VYCGEPGLSVVKVPEYIYKLIEAEVSVPVAGATFI
jgi:hypothetical protein